MTEENMTPETQDTSSEEQQELFFGKYKTKEEADAAHKELERKATEAQEALDREQRLNALLSNENHEQPQPQEDTTSQYVGLQGVFDEEQTQAVSGLLAKERAEILKQVRAEGRKMLDDYKVRQDTERQFYEEYGDLAHFKDDVDSEANKLALELGDRASRVPLKDLTREVAKRTREKLSAQKSKLTKAPIHVEGGDVVEPQVEFKSGAPKVTDESERTRAFFDKEVQDFDKRKLRPLRG